MSYRHLSPELLEEINDQIQKGVLRVSADLDGTASVTVALSVGIAQDKDGQTVVTYAHKHGNGKKTAVVYRPGQLGFGDALEDSVRGFRDTMREHGATVTLSRP